MNEAETAAGLAPTPGYRYAELIGRELFVAGQVPLDHAGAVVAPRDARRQAEQCLENLSTILAVHGFAVRHIRQLRVYVVGEHPALLDAWNGVVGWFDNDVPPATLLGVNRLGYGEQLVEIDARVIAD